MEARQALLRRHSFGDKLVLSAVLSGGVPIDDPSGSRGELSDGYCTVYGMRDGAVHTVYEPGNPLKWASIIVDRPALTAATGLESDELPASVRDFIYHGGTLPFHNVPLTGSASLAVSQILECRFDGSFRRAFLCAKTLELLCLVLQAFGSACGRDEGDLTLTDRDIRRIREARQIIERSLDTPLGIPELAAAVGTTRQKLQLGFRQIYGGTVAQIRDKLRLDHALHLVRNSQMPMTDIALEAGYEYLGSFTRAFRAAFGTCPSQMRRIALNETFR
jgi:AraC-like DNA-binding protein